MNCKRLLERLGLSADKNALQHFVGYLKSSVRVLLLATILLLVAACLRLITPLLTGYIIDRILLGGRITALNIIVPILFLLTICYLGSSVLRTYLLVRLKCRLQRTLRQDLLSKLSHLSFTYTSTKEAGYLTSRIMGDTAIAQGFVTDDLLSLAQHGLTLLVALVAMAWISWPTALVSLLIVPVHILIGSAYVPRYRCLNRECLEKCAQQEKILFETIAGMHTINACGAESQMLNRFYNSQTGYMGAEMERFWVDARIGTIRSFVAAAGPLIVLWFGGLQVIYGSMTVGNLIAFSAIFSQLFDAAQSLSSTHLSLQRVVVAVERLFEIMGQNPRIHTPAHPSSLIRVERGIRFHDVVFSYDGRSPTFCGLNLWIPARKIVALTGSSGAGKTTLVQLLVRFYEPDSGLIEIDGLPLGSLSLAWLRRAIVVVPQDIYLFSMSVEDNIRLRDPCASRLEVIEASKLANAHDFIEELPNGYETAVGERGTNLSGGQRQRIALARALLAKPQVLILDESLSANDEESERKIWAAIHRINCELGITVISIAHRLSTIRQADEIAVIENGHAVVHSPHSPSSCYQSTIESNADAVALSTSIRPQDSYAETHPVDFISERLQ